MVKHYWAFICRRAFKEACATIRLDTRERVVITGAVVGVGVLTLFLWGSNDAPGDETIMRFGIVVATFAILFFLFAWKVVSVPAVLDAERIEQVSSLRARLTPKIILSLPADAVSTFREGVTRTTINGERVSMMERESIMLRLTCTNKSDVRIDECQAFLVDAKAIEPDGRLADIGFRESVALLWSLDLAAREFETSLPQRTSKAIYLLQFTGRKELNLHRSTQEIPLEYHRLFAQGVRYRLWVQVNGKDDVAAQIALDVARDRNGDTLNTTVVISERLDPLLSGVIQAEGAATDRG